MKHQGKVAVGLVVAAALVGIGIIPVQRGLTVRYKGAPPKPKKQPARKPTRRRRRSGLARLLGK